MDRSRLMQAVMKYQPAAYRKPGSQLKGFQDVILRPVLDSIMMLMILLNAEVG
jgi:hypothetical protein